MRYLCVHCDHRFEHESDNKPRCPKCMRVHGVEAIREGGQGGAGGKTQPKWMWPVVIVVGIAAIAGGYAYWANRAPDTVSGTIAERPLERSELLGHLRRLSVDAREMVDLLSPNEDIEGLGERGTAGKSSNVDKARGVVDAIRARARKNAFVAWSLTEPRDTPVRTAGRTLPLLARDNARQHLYPLEVAALAVSALRTAGVDAMLAEAYGFAGDHAPPDPSGHFGYFLVAVWSGETGQGTPTLLDPYGGRTLDASETQHRVLTDVAAVAAALNLRAIHRLVRDSDSTRAFEEAQAAVKLDPRSPSIRGVRGAILLASGGVEEGMREFEAAAQIRGDPPRRNNLASVLLAKGDLDGAAREVASALEQARDFAAAHGTLAAVHMSRRDMDDARQELETAQRLDPELATLPMLWANYYLGNGETDRAVQFAEEAVRRRPGTPEAHLMLGRLYRQVGRFAEMRREARAALESAPAAQRQQVREVIRQVLGPTAFDDDEASGEGGEGGEVAEGGEAAEAGEGGEAALQEPGSLRLGGGSALLGEPGTAPPTPGGGNQGLLRLGDTSKLRLGGGSQDGLRLNLNE